MTDDTLKKPNQTTSYSEEKLLELMNCMDDPTYFMSNFMKVQHPTRGALSFTPYPYQIRLIKAFHEHKNTAVLAARQLGKCNTFVTNIKYNGKTTKIGKLLKLSFKEKLINFLEIVLLKLVQ